MIQRVSGVLLDLDEARYVAAALEHLCKVLRDNGRQPRPRLESLHTKLRKTSAATGVSAVNVSACGASGEDSGEDAGYATVTTAEAARIIGVSASGVRDMARRGRIRAHRPRGRWLDDSAAVELLAERRQKE